MLFAIVQEGCLTYVGGLLRGVSIAPIRQPVEPQKGPPVAQQTTSGTVLKAGFSKGVPETKVVLVPKPQTP